MSSQIINLVFVSLSLFNFVHLSGIWLWFACFVPNNQHWFVVDPRNWSFFAWKRNFLSCFKVLLSFCQVVPSSPPGFRKSVHNQIILSTNSIPMPPINIARISIFLFSVWYWKWRRQGKGIFFSLDTKYWRIETVAKRIKARLKRRPLKREASVTKQPLRPDGLCKQTALVSELQG